MAAALQLDYDLDVKSALILFFPHIFLPVGCLKLVTLAEHECPIHLSGVRRISETNICVS